MKTLNFLAVIGGGVVLLVVLGIYIILNPIVYRYSIPTFSGVIDRECGQFQTVPPTDGFRTVPVLIMASNSTACAELTFTNNYHPYVSNGSSSPSIFTPSGLLQIGNYNVTTNKQSFGISAGKDFTNLFQIDTVPQSVNLANLSEGSNFTVIYIVRPLPNAAGFYDHSLPRPLCEHYPLAVGFSADEVNSSDFSFINPLGPLCERGPALVDSVEISGMNYKLITLKPIPFK